MQDCLELQGSVLTVVAWTRCRPVPELLMYHMLVWEEGLYTSHGKTHREHN